MGTRTLETAKFPATGGTGRREVGLSRLSLVVSHRQRPQQRKHPEPLRRAVADCLSSGHHGATSVFSSEAVRTLEVGFRRISYLPCECDEDAEPLI